ncbi:MAG: YaaL family protein [Alkalibacterium gilvum]|uniref:YaaL family protein n=1 Tax=Alkalibacterium gilvum TaxID=1130080 RepID=UPI000A99998C|nr:YaaL family protein [Alkalibacterium gilvum]
MFNRNKKLQQTYDEKLIDLIQSQKRLCDECQHIEKVIVDKHPEWQAHYDLQKSLYFYLFKEARIRKINGDILN